MKIGMVGAGVVAQAIARSAIGVGHEVVLCNSGTADRLAEVVSALGPRASAATTTEVAGADIVLLAVPWLAVKDALQPIPNWHGRIVIDATNPFVQLEPKLVLADLGGDSASERVADLLPGARVVKAFNSILMKRFEEGSAVGSTRRVLFVSGDDGDAKATVSELIESFGFAAVDLGSLAWGGRLQQAGGALAGLDILVAS